MVPSTASSSSRLHAFFASLACCRVPCNIQCQRNAMASPAVERSLLWNTAFQPTDWLASAGPPPHPLQARACTRSSQCCTPSPSLGAGWSPPQQRAGSAVRWQLDSAPMPPVTEPPPQCPCTRAAAWRMCWLRRRGSGGRHGRGWRARQCCCSMECAPGRRGSWKVRGGRARLCC